MNATIQSQLADAVLTILEKWKTEEARLDWKWGASVSTVRAALVDGGWKGLGGTATFESMLESLGFKVVPARTAKGIRRSARAVTI